MIPERMEELAALYVLEVLNDAESQVFEVALTGDPELQSLVASLRDARDALAGAVPPAAPSPALKGRIMAKLEVRKPAAAPSPIRSWSAPFLGFWLPWALTAASVVIAVNLYLQKGALTQRVSRLDQLADSLRDSTNSLQQTVLALSHTTKMDDMRIALLGSLLNDSPKAVAVSLWDNQKQSGEFVVQNLKPLPANHDYQLWVIDPQYTTPVSAGVFQVDDQGNVRLHFKATKAINAANKFAVTLEPKGGEPTPNLKNLVLIGG